MNGTGRSMRGPLAVFVTNWVPRARATRNSFELVLTGQYRVEVRSGEKRKFSDVYPQGADIMFNGGRIEVGFEVLPYDLSKRTARAGKLPELGNRSSGDVHILDLEGYIRLAIVVTHVPKRGSRTFQKCVWIHPRERYQADLVEALTAIGVPQRSIQTVRSHLVKLVRLAEGR